jgi:hypothetical protein
MKAVAQVRGRLAGKKAEAGEVEFQSEMWKE